MSAAETIGVAGASLSFLLGLVVALIGVVYRNDQRVAERASTETSARLAALEAQNAAQERELATLKANTDAHETTFDRLATAVEKLDTKIDQLTQFLIGRSRTPPPFPGVKT